MIPSFTVVDPSWSSRFVQALLPPSFIHSKSNSNSNTIPISFTTVLNIHSHQQSYNIWRRNQNNHLNFGRDDQKQQSSVVLSMAKRSTAHLLTQQWLPSMQRSDDDIYAPDVEREQLEKESIEYVVTIIRKGLESIRGNNNSGANADVSVNDQVEEADESNQNDEGDRNNDKSDDILADDSTDVMSQLIKGRFRDLTCNIEGEKVLEDLLISNPPPTSSSITPPSRNYNQINVIRGAIIAMQSLLITGMQVGVKGSQEAQQRLVEHLYHRNDYSISQSSRHQGTTLETYFDNLTSRQLKHQVDTAAGIQILNALKRKRSTQSAYDLLVQLGIWEKHEDINLLRSGFPLRFTSEEVQDALEAENGAARSMEGDSTSTGSSTDPDDLLGLRKDLRSMKVYTIDSEFTNEIDDGLSIELVTKKDGSQRHRLWIHIADPDRWGKSLVSFFFFFRLEGCDLTYV